MKNLISLSLVFLFSCSQAPWKAPASQLSDLEAMLSPEDLKIHRCLHSQNPLTAELKSSCLQGSPYDSVIHRTPSQDSENDIIMKNNWFFGDQSKLNQFFTLSRGLVRASAKYVKVATNDLGVGVDGNAFFGFGRGWLAEVVNHHGHIGLFCAPYAMVTTDIGVTASVSVVKSISCPSNEAYAGGFLQIGASISGEAIGLPVDLGAAYSFGLDLPGFSHKIKESRRSGKLKLAEISRELSRFNDPAVRRAIAGTNRMAAILNIALKPVAVMGIRSPGISSMKAVNQVIKEALHHHRSLGVQFKSYYTRSLAAYLSRNNFPQMNEFFRILTSSMSGCDSVGGSAALALSLSPVEVNVQYQNYALLMEMQFEDLRALKVITPMGLLNPYLMNPEDLRAVVRVSRGILSIPAKVPRMCSTIFPRI